VPKTIYLPANIGILFEKKKEIGGIFQFSEEKRIFCHYIYPFQGGGNTKEGRCKMEDV